MMSRSHLMAAALRLTAPAGTAALITAWVAQVSQTPAAIGFGVAFGAIAGAAVGWLLQTTLGVEASKPPPHDETPRPRPAEAIAPPPTIETLLGGGRRALEAAPSALLLLEERGRIVFANAAARAEIGADPVGRHFSAALRAPQFVDAFNAAVDQSARSEFTFALRRGQERHMSAVVGAIDWPAGAPAPDGAPAPPSSRRRHVLVHITDNTRARRAEQLHRDFVANASHELKTPLAAITGFIETLRGPARDDLGAHERFLAIMAQEAERMRRLVDDLLSLNRIELHEHLRPTDAVALFPALEEAVADACAGRDGPLSERVALPPPDPTLEIQGDRRELVQMFANLVANALKYGGEKKPVRISLHKRTHPLSEIGVRVEDFGRGISKEHLPRLTERFYRAELTNAQGKSGTGLGLAIVKHVVARHRGELEIESELGRGSRFTVWLPERSEASAAEASAGDKSQIITDSAAGTR